MGIIFSATNNVPVKYSAIDIVAIVNHFFDLLEDLLFLSGILHYLNNSRVAKVKSGTHLAHLKPI